MSKRVKGTPVIIGWAERKDDERTALKVVADLRGRSVSGSGARAYYVTAQP